MIFDSHAHYDDERFDEIREEILADVHSKGVERIVNIGASVASSKRSLELANKYDFVYASVGVHPSDALRDMQNENWLNKIEAMYIQNEKCVAIGEIGLDYYYGAEEKNEQLKCFREQMVLADRLRAPVVIHDRDAHADTLSVIKDFPNVVGVVHSFSGSMQMAKEVLSLGYYISVNGVVTFKNAKKIVEIVENLRELHPDALDRILVETDCPYLTPVPFRGQLNHSANISYVAEKCAFLLGITKEEFCSITYKNACRFYGLE